MAQDVTSRVSGSSQHALELLSEELLSALSCSSQIELLVGILHAERCGFTSTRDALNSVLEQTLHVRNEPADRLDSTNDGLSTTMRDTGWEELIAQEPERAPEEPEQQCDDSTLKRGLRKLAGVPLTFLAA